MADHIIILPSKIEDVGTSWAPVVLLLTALAATMAVYTLVTGLILFKIIKVFLEVRPTLALTSSAENPKLQHIIFIIIESGMALFAIHLVRIVLTVLIAVQPYYDLNGIQAATAMPFVIASNQMLNVIIDSVLFYF